MCGVIILGFIRGSKSTSLQFKILYPVNTGLGFFVFVVLSNSYIFR